MNNYKLEKLIGNGTFGNIYKALDIRNNTYYACKKINKNLFFKNEINIIKNIKHKNIIQFHDNFCDKYYNYIFLELADIDIYYKMSYNDHSIDLIYDILYDVLSGVKYLHDNNIVHGDIKIENILDCAGIYKLCDFGLSFECKFMKRCQYNYSELKIPEVKCGIWGKPTDIWCIGKMIEKILLLYFYSKRYYLDTVCEKYFNLLKLSKLCFEKDYNKRITIDEILNIFFKIT